VLGNVFSIFPVSGIFSKDAVNVKFRFFYPITIFSAVVQLCFMVELVLLFIFLSNSGFKFFMVGELETIERESDFEKFNDITGTVMIQELLQVARLWLRA
jgi:hypothetical protein